MHKVVSVGKEEKDSKKRFIPGVILDDADEEVIYSLTGNSCSKCPLRGLCG